MKPKTRKNKRTRSKANDLWKNPSYRNMLNPYESKYPQEKKKRNDPASK